LLKPVYRFYLAIVVLLGVIVLALLAAKTTHTVNLGPPEVLSDHLENNPIPADLDPKTTANSTNDTQPAPPDPMDAAPTPKTNGTENSPTSSTPLSNSSGELPPRDPTKWHDWPVLPNVSPELHQIYLKGLEQGNDPHAFSILGDCQSQPDVFMGVFDEDSSGASHLPENLQETVAQFSGSFDRYSPTVKDGTTEGALLWIEWNDNREGKCNNGETPLDCELRVHKPSIVFIHVGTHYEDRNRHYLVTILDKILKTNAIPVFVTKADNLERDGRINAMIAALAAEYQLPLWNFWASVQHLPNHGLKIEDSKYLTEDGEEIHRMGALKALDAVWRGLN
jgi:hypothetical protein